MICKNYKKRTNVRYFSLFFAKIAEIRANYLRKFETKDVFSVVLQTRKLSKNKKIVYSNKSLTFIAELIHDTNLAIHHG